MKFFDIKSPSSLVLIFEKLLPLKGKHLIVAPKDSLEKIKSFLFFKPSPLLWYELPDFPYPKTPGTKRVLLKRIRFQAFAQDPESSGLFLASPQALLKKTYIAPSNFASASKVVKSSTQTGGLACPVHGSKAVESLTGRGKYEAKKTKSQPKALKEPSTGPAFMVLKPGDSFPYESFKFYRRTEFIEQPGDYSPRSFIIDLFSPVYKKALRFELLGDQIRSIHFLDSQFKRRESLLERALISPLEEWSRDSGSRKQICEQLRRQEQSLKQFLAPDLYKNFSRSLSYFGFESLLNICDKTSSLDYFPDSTFIYLIQTNQSRDSFLNEIYKWEKEHSFFTAQNLFLDWERLEKAGDPKAYRDRKFLDSRFRGTEDGRGPSKHCGNDGFGDSADSGGELGSDGDEGTVGDFYSFVEKEKTKYVLFSDIRDQILKQIKQTQNYKRELGISSRSSALDTNNPPSPPCQGGNSISEILNMDKGGMLENPENSNQTGIDIAKQSPAESVNLVKAVNPTESVNPAKMGISTKFQQTRTVLKQLPVSSLVFAGLKIPEFKQFLKREQIIKNPDSDFFYQKSLIFIEKPLKESFIQKAGTAYLRIEDFFKEKKPNSFSLFRKKARALEFSSLEEGDLLVHIQNGLGEFIGLQTLNLKGKTEDFIVLKYQGGDKLFVPAYRLDEVKKYSKKPQSGFSKALLDVLGKPGAWERKKAKAKKHIQSLAIELIELYKVRKQKKRPAFLPVLQERKDFEKDFPWMKTRDQQRAIQEIMSDMDQEFVMDRLLVGDTGFGKTEVALTAVCRALANNYQVCFLAPTTILSLQHFKNFVERFKNTHYQLALLNRFTSKKEQLFKQVREGQVDFLIATHSVFNPQLCFKNLGLLVLDEEHRFGVRQKEKLFRFRQNLDVLALSATPIPRTLNMALTGIKDISVITQPPEKRKPVKMFLKSWEPSLNKDIVNICQIEKARGGQVLFIYNRVKSLYQRAEDLSRLLPDFKIAIAHGKSHNLDRIILDFFNQKYDLLLSTNIVESGMDIPLANTLFIDRSHEMGLSQIYQLKGRVGRGDRQAYCYLLYPEKDRLSPLAKERLNLLETYTYLGSSFQLALYDLENRGAGSLFGSEQSGHIQSLGEEFYFEILNEHLKSQEGLFIEPEISLPFSAGIPVQYIPDPRLRLLYYKNLSESQEESERLAIKQDMQEDFGELPEELESLFALLSFREICKKQGIIDFKATQSFLKYSFHKDSPVPPEKIIQLVEQRQGQMLSENTIKIPLNAGSANTGDILKESRKVFAFFNPL